MPPDGEAMALAHAARGNEALELPNACFRTCVGRDKR